VIRRQAASEEGEKGIIMCSNKLIRLSICRKAYTVLFILLYGLTAHITHAAISNRSKSLGES